MMSVRLVIPWSSIGPLIARLQRVVEVHPEAMMRLAPLQAAMRRERPEVRGRRGRTGRWCWREAPAEYRLDATEVSDLTGTTQVMSSEGANLFDSQPARQRYPSPALGAVS
jgi:hypothetical protein